MAIWIIWLLAFLDLAVAGVMAVTGHRGIALGFMVLAVLTVGFALFAKPTVRRNARGRLETVDPPWSRLIATTGTMVILVAAAYVALSTERRSPDEVQRDAPAQRPVVSGWQPPPAGARPQRDAGQRWLYKCVAADGHASFQSQPCAPGTEQAWRRPATPEPEPPRRALSQRQPARTGAAPSTRALQ